MAEPFLAEIRIFAFNRIPRGWLPCDGQILPIQSHQALFAILGTQYGGDGRTTFGLPNLQGRAAIHPDASIPIGQTGGEETHTLQINEIPSHNHMANAGSGAESTSPAAQTWGTSFINSYGAAADTVMSAEALGKTGANAPHENRQPYAVLQYCIAMEGIWPPHP